MKSDVLAFTLGKKVLMAGGQGAREAHRVAIQESFQLKSLEWAYGERGQKGFFSNLARRIHANKYDFVLFLAGFSSHSSGVFIEACRDAGIRVVYLSKGYSVNRVREAIKQQAMAKPASKKTVSSR